MGRLDGITLLLPDADQFLYSYSRLGRLLVTLLLCSETADGEFPVLSRPLLYLSLHLKRHRDTYYQRLQAKVPLVSRSVQQPSGSPPA